MNNKANKSLLSDLQYFLDNDATVIASDSKSGKRLLRRYVSDPTGTEWRVVFRVQCGSYTEDSELLSWAVNKYNLL